MDFVNRRRNRRFATKTRGGCQMCRRRHTRCSQERPTCSACKTSGRQCSYECPSRLSPGDDLKVVQWKPRDNEPRKSPSATNWSGNEVFFLQFFQEVCCAQLIGSFDDAFWKRTIYQISETTPAVRHAIIAVCTSWQKLDVQSEAEPSTKLDPEKGLRHYLSALSYVRALSEQRESPDMHAIMVCNILFYCIELCQHDYESALRQLSSGLDVFCDWIRDSRAMNQEDGHIEEIGQNLVKVFRKMLPQTILFMDTHLMIPRIFEPEMKIDSYDIPRDFNSAEEARDCLHTLLSACIHQSVSVRMVQANLAGQDHQVSRPVFRLAQQELEQFMLAFDRFCERQTPLNRKGTMQRAAIWSQYLALKILAAASVSDRAEWAFDQHLPEFERIVRECSKAIDLFLVGSGGSFCFDMEVISPLYFVAGRCRDSRIRKEALRLLRMCDRQEGVWSGPMTAAIVEHIIYHEEAGLAKGSEGLVADVKNRLTLTTALVNSRERVLTATFAKRRHDSQDIEIQVEQIAY